MAVQQVLYYCCLAAPGFPVQSWAQISPNSQKHAGRWIGYAKLPLVICECVHVCAWCLVMDWCLILSVLNPPLFPVFLRYLPPWNLNPMWPWLGYSSYWIWMKKRVNNASLLWHVPGPPVCFNIYCTKGTNVPFLFLQLDIPHSSSAEVRERRKCLTTCLIPSKAIIFPH